MICPMITKNWPLGKDLNEKKIRTQGEEHVCRGQNSLTALNEMLLRPENLGHPRAHLENMPM